MLANRRQTKDLSETETATATMCDVHMQRVMPEILERRRRRKTVENGEPQAHKHAQQHTTHYHVYAALCVPARCEFHSIYKHIYFPFFLCFSVFFMFIFRIVKQLAALLDTSRVRCFDKMWFSAPSLRQMSARGAALPSLLQ